MSIKIERTDIHGWEAAIRGARNPMNSWEKSDSWFLDYSDIEEIDHCHSFSVKNAIVTDSEQEGYLDIHWIEYQKCPEFIREINHLENVQDHPYDWPYGCKAFLGPKDHDLLMRLCKGGTEESKWRRFVNVTMDITAPLYWWKEFETYKIGTVSNSCSTMHKIQAKEFTSDDFSCDHLLNNGLNLFEFIWENGMFAKSVQPMDFLTMFIIPSLNKCREKFLETKDKRYWWQMIQLLPSSYNQRRTIQLNYEVLAKQYKERKNHKLDEWRDYCVWIETLPYSEFITLKENEDETKDSQS